MEASDKQPNGVASGAVLEAQASALFPGWMEKLSSQYTFMEGKTKSGQLWDRATASRLRAAAGNIVKRWKEETLKACNNVLQPAYLAFQNAHPSGKSDEDCKRAVREAVWEQKLRQKKGAASSSVAKKARLAKAQAAEEEGVAEVADSMLAQPGAVLGAPAAQAVQVLGTAVQPDVGPPSRFVPGVGEWDNEGREDVAFDDNGFDDDPMDDGRDVMPADFNGGVSYLAWLHLGPYGLQHTSIIHVTPPAALPTKPGAPGAPRKAGGGRAASRAAAQAVGGMPVRGDADHPILCESPEQQAQSDQQVRAKDLILIRKQECATENFNSMLRVRKARRKELHELMSLLPAGSPQHTEARQALVTLLQEPAPLPPSFPLSLAASPSSQHTGSGSSSTTAGGCGGDGASQASWDQLLAVVQLPSADPDNGEAAAELQVQSVVAL